MSYSNWADWSAFVAMGGYGQYVWGSFGMVGAGIVVELLSLRARRQALRAREAHTGFGAAAHEA